MTTATPLETAQALKEWSVAIAALTQGETIVLLRKGGLREQGGRFTVPHERVLLYPTYEHQQPHLLKPAYASQVVPVESGWHPTEVCIRAWASVTDTFQVCDRDRMLALLPFHIWNEQFVLERLQWKPQQPVFVLLLRVYRLPQPQTLAYDPRYGGCKSWIQLATPLVLDDQAPVLTASAYAEQVNEIRSRLLD